MDEILQQGDLFSLPGFEERLRQYAAWLIQLRWVATAATAALILAACPLLHLLPAGAFWPLWACVGGLALLNLLFARQVHRSQDPGRLVRFQLLSDLAILTALLHFSGGIENPFFIAYGFHGIIAGIFLPRRAAYGLPLVASGLLALLAVGELTGLLPHYDIRPFDFLRKGGAVQHAAHNPLYVFGHLLPFVGFLFCTTAFITRIAGYLRRSEERLIEAARIVSAERQKLESVVHAAEVGMILLDRDLQVGWFNPRVREWFGWQEDRLGRRCVWYDAAGQTTAHPCIASRTVQTGEVLQAERALCETPGRSRFYHVTTSPIRDEGGRIVQVVELVQEITARKLAEAEVLHAGKMAVLGQVAAGITHEIGKPLSSLSTRLRRMEKHQDDPGFLQESLQALRDQIGRIGRIVHDVSQFARPSQGEWSSCQLNRILLEVLEGIRLDHRARGIEIDLRLAEPLPGTMGVRDQLVQVFLNLGLNAVEAMAGKGLLVVESAAREGEICVSFRDTGPGMTAEAQAHLLRPFFTTREQGSGFGLSISHRIVQGHGGRIEVQSRQGEGTTFVVCLPVRQPRPSMEAQEQGASWQPRS